VVPSANSFSPVGLVAVFGASSNQTMLFAVVMVSGPFVTADADGPSVTEVDAAVDALPEEFRVAVVLRDVCDLDYSEIARTLVDLGVELHELITLKRLREGLQACLSHLRDRKSGLARWGQNVHSNSQVPRNQR